MAIDNSWYTEECPEGGSAFSMKLKEKVYEEQTPYQLIEIYETEFFGTLMTLAGLVMLTDRDNFIYHEMLVHPALFLREALRHPDLQTVEMVEIDERVTRVAERFFPELCEANNDSRARLHFTDGIKWVADAAPENYDVIIVDSTDPVGPAVGLYSQAFYASCFKALGAHGVLVAQSESPLYHLDLIKNMRSAMAAAGFPAVAHLHFPQCTYPSGWWTATLACKKTPATGYREHAAAQKTFPTRYYNHSIHKAALAAPTFFLEALS
jgi:spermidine synthase